MRISLEQQDSLNKVRCKQLKEIRNNMANELGISLNQTECQNNGYCSGTCPKCQAEEKLLNDAIKKQQHKGNTWKKKTMVAGLLVATSISMSSCTLNSNDNLELGGEAVIDENIDYNNQLNGDVAWTEEDEEQTPPINQDCEANSNSSTIYFRDYVKP